MYIPLDAHQTGIQEYQRMRRGAHLSDVVEFSPDEALCRVEGRCWVAARLRGSRGTHQHVTIICVCNNGWQFPIPGLRVECYELWRAVGAHDSGHRVCGAQVDTQAHCAGTCSVCRGFYGIHNVPEVPRGRPGSRRVLEALRGPVQGEWGNHRDGHARNSTANGGQPTTTYLMCFSCATLPCSQACPHRERSAMPRSSMLQTPVSKQSKRPKVPL